MAFPKSFHGGAGAIHLRQGGDPLGAVAIVGHGHPIEGANLPIGFAGQQRLHCIVNNRVVGAIKLDRLVATKQARHQRVGGLIRADFLAQ